MTWEEVYNAKARKLLDNPAPFEELDPDGRPMVEIMGSRYGNWESEHSPKSEAGTMKTLPSFVGEIEMKSDILKVPTQYRSVPPTLDTENLQAILSTPIKVTLPLAEIIKVRPYLWE